MSRLLSLRLFKHVSRVVPFQSRLLSSSGASASEDLWSWVPPREKSDRQREDYVIPVIKGVMLTPEEVRDSLVAQGGEDVIILPLKESIDTITSFVIASGKSHRLIRKMSESVVMALKDRGLHKTLGSKGVEGEKEDDWQVVDCHKFLVHVLIPETRKHLDLESHWSLDVRPSVPYAKDEKEYEANFAKMLEMYPCPPDYIKDATKVKNENEFIGKL